MSVLELRVLIHEIYFVVVVNKWWRGGVKTQTWGFSYLQETKRKHYKLIPFETRLYSLQHRCVIIKKNKMLYNWTQRSTRGAKETADLNVAVLRPARLAAHRLGLGSGFEHLTQRTGDRQARHTDPIWKDIINWVQRHRIHRNGNVTVMIRDILSDVCDELFLMSLICLSLPKWFPTLPQGSSQFQYFSSVLRWRFVKSHRSISCVCECLLSLLLSNQNGQVWTGKSDVGPRFLNE